MGMCSRVELETTGGQIVWDVGSLGTWRLGWRKARPSSGEPPQCGDLLPGGSTGKPLLLQQLTWSLQGPTQGDRILVALETGQEVSSPREESQGT